MSISAGIVLIAIIIALSVGLFVANMKYIKLRRSHESLRESSAKDDENHLKNESELRDLMNGYKTDLTNLRLELSEKNVQLKYASMTKDAVLEAINQLLTEHDNNLAEYKDQADYYRAVMQKEFKTFDDIYKATYPYREMTEGHDIHANSEDGFTEISGRIIMPESFKKKADNLHTLSEKAKLVYHYFGVMGIAKEIIQNFIVSGAMPVIIGQDANDNMTVHFTVKVVKPELKDDNE